MAHLMILAIGNAGGNIVEAIRKETKHTGLKEAQYVFADCTESDLDKHKAHDSQLILLNADKCSLPDGIFNEVENLVILVGLGGNTGTMYALPAAKAAVEAGVASVNMIATLPFVFEGDNRIDIATSEARKFTDVEGMKVTVYNNEELWAKYPDLSIFDAFKTADKEIMKIIEDIL